MRELRCCGNCGHLWTEHKHVAFLDCIHIEVYSATGYCHACECNQFVDEPDFVAPSTSGER